MLSPANASTASGSTASRTSRLKAVPVICSARRTPVREIASGTGAVQRGLQRLRVGVAGVRGAGNDVDPRVLDAQGLAAQQRRGLGVDRLRSAVVERDGDGPYVGDASAVDRDGDL